MPTTRQLQRYARKGTTTARGYGWTHALELKRCLARWQPGQPCAICGHPMWHRWAYDRRGRRVTAIHLGHNADRTGYIGLCHAHCNTSEGATRGNVQRGTARQWQQARRW